MKKRTIGVVGLAAVALIGGTFAYFTQTSMIDNPFDTAYYQTEVIEEFTPKKDWKPGEEVNKDLYVKNTGSSSVVVRVKFQEIWQRDGQNTPFHEVEPADIETIFQYPDEKTGPFDGKVEGDKSVIKKNFNDYDKWQKASDGWYYFKEKLDPDRSTGKFLDSVTLIPNVDIGKMMTQYYYTTDENVDSAEWIKTGDPMPATAASIIPQEGWKATKGVTKAEENALGYSGAHCTLKITVQTVQATDEAVKTIFPEAPAELATVKGEGKGGWQLEKESLAGESETHKEP